MPRGDRVSLDRRADRRRATGRCRAAMSAGRSVVVDRRRIVPLHGATRCTRTTSGCRTARRNTRAAIPSRSRRSPTAAATSARSTPSIAGRVGPGVSFDYGGRYARYDYLERPGPLQSARGPDARAARRARASPRSLAQRMVAPGAEEFLPPSACGPLAAARADVLAARRHVSCASSGRGRSTCSSSTSSASTYVVGVRRFFQGVDNQPVTIFGINMPTGPSSVGHYYVASAGGVDAEGWGVRFGTARRRSACAGSVDYSVARGDWKSRGDLGGARPWVASLARPELEDIHDITASFATDIPETATRVFVLYKVNTAFARARTHLTRCRHGRPVRRAGEPGAAVRAWRHQVGGAGRRPEPVPRSERPGVDLRRAARRPSAQARRRRIPGAVLTRGAVRSAGRIRQPLDRRPFLRRPGIRLFEAVVQRG